MRMSTPPLASFVLFAGALLSGIRRSMIGSVAAFSPTTLRRPTTGAAPPATTSASERRSRPRRSSAVPGLFESRDEDDSIAEGDENAQTAPPRKLSTEASANKDNSLAQRFLSPRIDDPGLPLTDVLLAQIVAPSFQIFWLALNRAPNPSWLQPISSYFGEAPELAPRGSLLAPTLIHGAGLAVCWLAGALAARMYEREAFTLRDIEGGDDDSEGRSSAGLLDAAGRYNTILIRLVQAGAFASGILILSTQMDLLLEFGRWVQYGESDATDLRLLVATVEVINDVFWEALVICSWRLIHANFMSNPGNRLRRF